MSRQSSLYARESGFTLIEVLVIVLVIGILAAIVVPSFQGLQDGVRQAATQSDLRSNRTALIEYAIDNNGVFPTASGFNPRSASTDLTGYGWSQSAETTGYHYSTNAAGTAFCLDMTNSTGAAYRITANPPSSAGVSTVTGLCSAIATSSY